MPNARVCFLCQQPLEAGKIRTMYWTTFKVHICKLCFLKLSEKDRANSKAQSKLRHQVEDTQAELPF